MEKVKWTQEMTNYLVENYPDQNTGELAEALNMKIHSIYYKAKTLNLRKSDQYRAALKQANINCLLSAGKEHRFNPGHEPANKGKKREITGAMSSTFFKKGQTPHNTLSDGAIRIRKDKNGTPWKFIRISKNNWIHLHRKLWHDANGKVPTGHMVAFKDGNTLNCTIENLFLLSKADNMRRNTIHQYPDEIKAAIRDLSKLKKAIKNAS